MAEPATSQSSIPAFPDKIGKYDIINAIGAGSTGSVYLSHDPYFRRDVAIKVYDVVEDEDELDPVEEGEPLAPVVGVRVGGEAVAASRSQRSR